MLAMIIIYIYMGVAILMRKITIQQWSLGSHMTNPYMVHLLSRVARWTFACGRFEVLSTVIAGGISALCEKLEVISVPVRQGPHVQTQRPVFFLVFWMQVMNSSCNKLHVKSASIGVATENGKDPLANGFGPDVTRKQLWVSVKNWAVPMCLCLNTIQFDTLVHPFKQTILIYLGKARSLSGVKSSVSTFDCTK